MNFLSINDLNFLTQILSRSETSFLVSTVRISRIFFLKIENFHPKIDEINMQTEILKSTGQKRPATSWQTVFDGVTFQLIPTLEVSLEVNRIISWFRSEDNGLHEEQYRMLSM